MAEGVLILYLVVATGCMALTWNEYLQGNGRLAGAAAGLLACAVWPLVGAAMMVSMARRA